MECKRAQNLIDAFLDGELDPVHSAEVEGHLRECEGCARVLENRRVLQRALREKLPYYSAPLGLRHAVEGRTGAGGGGVRGWKIATMAMAACLAVAVGGLTLMVVSRGGGTVATDGMVAAVESDHLRSLLTPEHLYDVESTDKHTVKPWFAGKLAYAPPVPDLKAQGFELLGGRLDVLNGETVAALVYKRDKHKISLFVWPASGAGAKESPVSEVMTTSRGHHVVHWTWAGIECWAVSAAAGGQLQELARDFEKVVEGKG